MKKKNKDYLRNTNIELYQDDEMFCVNTDTIILGSIIKCKKGDSVLDIGTNNGALLLYISKYEPSLLCGVDYFKEAIEIAKENLEMNNLKYELYNVKIQDFNHEKFDVIVSNPPFFKNERGKNNTFKEIAMFDDNLSVDDLFAAFKRLLKDNGIIYMIYVADRIGELYKASIEYKFKIMEMTYIYDNNRPYAKRVILKIKKGDITKTIIKKPIYTS